MPETYCILANVFTLCDTSDNVIGHALPAHISTPREAIADGMKKATRCMMASFRGSYGCSLEGISRTVGTTLPEFAYVSTAMRIVSAQPCVMRTMQMSLRLVKSWKAASMSRWLVF